MKNITMLRYQMPFLNKPIRRKRETNPYTKSAEVSKIYNTNEWRSLRLAKLQDNPLCENCERNGKVTAATQVHHKQFISTGDTLLDMQSLGFDYNNLMSLCEDCHHKFHSHAKKHNQNYIDYLKL